MHILIVGGGNVAEEKLRFLTKSSPDANITMVSPMFREISKGKTYGYRNDRCS